MTGTVDQQSPSPARRHVGFWTASFSVFRATAFIVRTPRAWPYAIVPPTIALALLAAAAYVAVALVAPAARNSITEQSSWLGSIAATAAEWAAAIASLLLGVLVAFMLTPTLSSPALEKIVSITEQAHGVPPRRPPGFFAELGCGLRAQSVGLLVGIPVLGFLSLTSLLLPFSSVVTIPLEYATVALATAYNLFDYPLTLRGVPIRERLRWMRQNWRPSLGFGVGFALLFTVPCFAILMLPPAVAGATRLLASLGALGAASGARSERAPGSPS